MQKNKRNAIRNKIVGIMCIAALAANTAPSVIPAPYVNAFAQESTGSTVSLNSSTETVPFDEASATVIDISQLEPNDENRIVAELNTSGTYILKGSNFINEAYVDATIYVPRGVTANVILDGVNIDNDDGGNRCAEFAGAVSPFDVKGTLNLYTKSDSEIKFYFAQIDGTLNICGYGDNSAKLKLSAETNQCGIMGSGTMNIRGGNNDIDLDGSKGFFGLKNLNVSGGKTYLNAFLNSDIKFVVTGGDISVYRSGFGIDPDPVDAKGRELHDYDVTIEDMTAETEILQIDSTLCSDLSTDSEGNVKLWLPTDFSGENEKHIIYTADAAYVVSKSDEDGSIKCEKSDSQVHKVTFSFDDSSEIVLRVIDGESLELPESVGYDYTFSDESGNAFTGENITSDVNVTVLQVIREFTVSVNGQESKYKYGDILEIGADKIGVDSEGNTYGESFEVTSDMTLYLFDVTTIDKAEYLKISNADELRNYSKITEQDLTFNAVLTDDVDVPSDVMIGLSWGSSYKATFDGNGHKLTVNYSSSDSSYDYIGVFKYLGDGAIIRNLTVDGRIEGDNSVTAGGITAFVSGEALIENCTSGVDLIANSADENVLGGIAGYLSSECTIRNCLVTGSISNSSENGHCGGLIGESINRDLNFSNNVILGDFSGVSANSKFNMIGYKVSSGAEEIITDGANNYCSSDNAVGSTINIAVADESEFSSGEVAYKLRTSTSVDGSVWGQKIGSDKHPVIGGTPVFYNKKYNDCTCESYSMIYTNDEQDIIPAHHFEDGKCTVCSAFEDGVGARLLGYQADIDSMIGFKFYMELDESIANSSDTYMLFTLPDSTTQKVYMKDAVKNENGSYAFTCMLAPKWVNSNVKAQIISGDKAGTEYVYSVFYYLQEVDSSTDNTDLKNLCESMLVYGLLAERYFDPEMEEITETDEMLAVEIPPYEKQDVIEGTLPDGITYYGTSLVLDSMIELRKYYIVESEEIAQQYSSLIHKSGKYYYESVPFSSFLSFPEPDHIGEGRVYSSPQGYMYRAYNETSDVRLKALLKILYIYTESAKSYIQNTQLS